MKLCVDARMVRHSGIGVHLRHMLAELLKLGELEISLLGDPGLLRDFREAGATIIPASAPVYSLAEQWELPLRVPHCDVFWSPHFNIPLAPLRARRRFVTIHDAFHLRFSRELPRMQRIYARLFFSAIPRLSHGLASVSRASAEEIGRWTGIPPERFVITPNAVDRTRFHPQESPLADLAARRGIHRPFVLFVGNLKPHKNILRTLGAWSRIAGFIEEDLVLVGRLEGHRQRVDGLPRRVAELDGRRRVHLIEDARFDELPLFYSAARLFVFPSLFEGFGIPPLEAMACETPALVSNIPPLREVCADAALAVDPEDETAIAGGMLRLLRDQNLRHRLTERGRERVAAFSWRNSARVLADRFHELTSGVPV